MITRVRTIVKDEGYKYLLNRGIIIANSYLIRFSHLIQYNYVKIVRSSRNFSFNGKSYDYFYHKYNTTWRNERAVEVPIIKKIIEDYDPQEILEVGNVLSYYLKVEHDIVDKYDTNEGVITCDICQFQTSKKYNLIICISTLEHVGWDECVCSYVDSPDPNKIPQAIEKMKSLLSDNGKIIITVPTAYNPVLDNLLKEDELNFNNIYHLKRISKDNKWIESNKKEIENLSYNKPFNNANGLIIGIIE